MQLPVHFFTIVLNGRPFIERHAPVFEKLDGSWHWHVVEGVAESAPWRTARGGTTPKGSHKAGLSIDGTSEYLDRLAAEQTGKVTVYRARGDGLWISKDEMVRQPLVNLPPACLLWEVDADEIWTVGQIERMRRMFASDQRRTAAWFWCNYYVGPQTVVLTRNCFSQNPSFEWLRVWNYREGDKWHSHEPPLLVRTDRAGNARDVGRINPFLHEETEANGLVFDHFAYASKCQAGFKEVYYGYRGATAGWERLQTDAKAGRPLPLKDYFEWVNDQTLVGPRSSADGAGQSASADSVRRRGGKSPSLLTLASRSAAWCIRLPYRAAAACRRIFGRRQKLRVALSTFGWTPFSGGAGNYMMSLILAWADWEKANPLRLYATKSVFDHLKRLPFSHRVYFNCLAVSRDIVKEERDFDVFFQIGHLEPVPPPRKAVYNLADLQERFFPEFFTSEAHADRHENHLAGLRYAWRIVTGSKFSLKSFRELLRMPADLASLAYLPVADLPRTTRRPEGLPAALKRYAYFPADDFLHKNHRRVMRAVALLRSRGHDVSLVLSGGRFFDRNFATMAAEEGLQEGFVDLGKVSREEVSWLYRNAEFLLFGSLFEGFGLPVLEALLSDTPVVCSGVTSLPEVGGDAALYFNPFDESHMADQAARILEEPDQARRLVSNGRRQRENFAAEKVVAMHKAIFLSVKEQARRLEFRPDNLPPIDEQLAWQLYASEVPDEIRDMLPRTRPERLVESAP